MRLTLRRPDDMHLHLRDGAVLAGVIGATTRSVGRAIIMPNLVPPVVTGADAAAYRARILAALPPGADFQPLMTLYLTETTDADDVARAGVAAVKLYPAGATTNSHGGVRDLSRVMPVLERMADIGLALCVHGEVTDPDVDIFDRESVFIDRVLVPLRQRLPQLRVTLEHVTTRQGVDFVRSDPGVAATITTHHLLINRNHLLVGGIRPHYYCLPVAKRETHRLALVEAATGGHPRFFSGTDSAPHVVATKESACGCAGCFTALNSLECLAQVFDDAGALAKLEAFTSRHGAAWYGLPPNDATVTLTRSDTPTQWPATVDTAAGPVAVFDPARPIFWRLEPA